MKYKDSSEILVAVVAGFLGVCVAVSLILWARLPEITKDIEGTANEQYGNLQRSIAEMVSTEKTNFSTQQRQAVELLGRAERANDSSQTNYTTAMTSIWELDRRVKALEAKTK